MLGNIKRAFFQGIRPFSAANAAGDALAGFQLAAMAIPQSLGYTRIAGTPVVTGLYTLLLPMVAFATLGSSRVLVVAADSATAAILAGGISRMAPTGSARYMELAVMVALLTAGFLLLARILRLGFLADFLSQTVLVGFLTGVGFQVGIAVLDEMLGLEVASHRSITQLAEVLRDLPHAHLSTAGISVAVVACVLLLRRLAPHFPGALLAVAAGIGASMYWDLGRHGVQTIGPVLGGLPRLALPRASWTEVAALLPIAASCFVMIVAQSAATARVYAARNRDHVDENADLLGLSAANAAAALSGTFVVNGSPTQTAMVENAGCRSQVAHLSTAGVVALVLLFLTGPLEYLPRCVLGAVVFTIAIHLVDIRGLREIRRESHGEYLLALLTAAVVVLVGVEQGILLAMVASLLRIVQHSYRPRTAVLIRDKDGLWSLTPAVPGTLTEPGLIIYRFAAALFYANAPLFADEVRALVRPAPSPVRWLIVDAGPITHVDYTAARVLRELLDDLAQAEVGVLFAHVQADLAPDLERHRLTQIIGRSRIFDSLHEALDAVRGGKL
jgi:SulP family sulfate permease